MQQFLMLCHWIHSAMWMLALLLALKVVGSGTPPPPLYKLRHCESVGLSVGTCRWTFHRSWISYALVQATVGVGTVLIWDLILIRYQT